MTTWDPGFKAAHIALSNANLTATSATAVAQLVRSTTSKNAGLVFLEFTLNTITADSAVGIVNASEITAPPAGIGGDANSGGFYAVSPAQATYANGTFLNGGTTASGNGAIVSAAINFNTTPPTVWFTTAAMRAAGTPYNNSATADPATGVGGQPLTGLGAGPYFAAFNDDNGGAVCTVNFGASGFNRPIPTGYSAWDVLAGSAGVAAGHATVAGVGASRTAGRGFAAGHASVRGISPGAIGSVGRADGLATVSGVSGFVVSSVSPSFDYTPTIISQYANSPTIRQLITNFAGYLDNTVNIDAFFNLVWNVDTAVGYGLDVWGRIVGVGRVLNIASGIYFGFAEASDATSISPFNAAGPFFSGGATTGNFSLSDDAFRLLIFAKALSNISDGSIPAINQILLNLFPGRGNCYVTDGRDMTMTYTFRFNPVLTPVEFAIVSQSGILPKPVGVLATVVQI